MNVELVKYIYWVGYIDWDLRNFHGYSTPEGSTYNAYLIVDDQPTLIDTVKHYGFEDMVRRITQIIDPAQLRYIISNHTEMDHSGSIDRLLELCPQAEVVCSPKGAEGLKRHFKKDWKMKVVNTGDTLPLGRRTLQFVLMPMVHWPDSMATYSPADALLFPNDAFGQHYASSERFVDEVGLDVIMKAAAKYYANIVMPYGAQVNTVLDAVSKLTINAICPSHGLMWRRAADISRILASYRAWASHRTESRAVIIYDTMWHSTELMAKTLFAALEDAGIAVSLINLQAAHLSDAMTEILRARVVLLGSPILNNRVLPTMAGFLTYMKGLKPRNRFGMTFGSYGWATVGFKEMEEAVTESGMKLLGPGTYVQYIPAAEDLERVRGLVPQIQQVMAVNPSTSPGYPSTTLGMVS